MAKNYNQDRQRVEEFYVNNWNNIKGIFNETAKLYNIEFDNNEIAKCFDQYCGIDFIASDNKKVYGIAARVNFMSQHHNHITIRYQRTTGAKTEYQKRIESITKMGGEIYASLTMQFDANPGTSDQFVRAILFQSDKLYMAINANFNYYKTKYLIENKSDGNLFFKIPHSDIIAISKQNNVHAKIYEPSI